MLRELSIENLAVIEKATARFGDRFNVFSGETGAGKSILIGGINAILGHRTSKEIVRTGTEKAVITALFDGLPGGVLDKLTELGYEPSEELVLTREIFADGKSVARINGRTAAAGTLKELGALLVDVHGQHENRILMSNDSQRDLLDNYAGLGEELKSYREVFREFARVSKRLKALNDDQKNLEYKIEYLNSVIEELSPLDLEKGDGERLERELEETRKKIEIVKACWGAYYRLVSDGDGPSAIEMLEDAQAFAEEAAESNPMAEMLAQRMAVSIPELRDIADTLYGIADDLSDTGVRANELEEKVAKLKKAQRRYNRDCDGLVDFLDECIQELEEINGSDSLIEELDEQKHFLAEQLRTMAAGISEKRKAAAERLSKEICGELEFLNMPNVKIIFAVNPDKTTINGKDSIELLISANAGEEPRPLNKIASGGELSRIMLAIKSVLAELDNVPTLIFDEVDSGISGKAAQKVGIKLAQTAHKRQVLCITHLAQIACRADCHLLIEKESDAERTFTRITELDFEGRKRELARIIDGTVSESALAAAEEMLQEAISGDSVQ